MRLRRAVAPILLLALSLPGASQVVSRDRGSDAAARDLSFEDRVLAAQAIERVLYAHQVGAALPFEEAVPAAVLQAKVARYLEQSVALAAIWRAPVTAEALRAEWQRIRAQSRLPERLREIEAALGHDPFVIEECYARPILVDRLARAFYAADPEAAGAVRGRSWDEWWAESHGRFDLRLAEAVAEDGTHVPLEAPVSRETAAIAPFPSPFTCDDENTWLPLESGGAPDSSSGTTAVWTGSVMIVWGGANGPNGDVTTGARYDPVTDTWSPVSSLGAPAARSSHTAVWTGHEMIVWGGLGPAAVFNSGGRYDPVTDTWSPTSTTGAPSARGSHAAVWTGREMIVWGGSPSGSFGTPTSTGGVYDPVADLWRPVSQTNVPSARNQHTAVWTGSRMIIWGGAANSNSSTIVNTGGQYDPATDTWRPTSMAGAPSPREAHTATWTGSRMVIWGGYLTGYLDTGGRYDPATDTWQPTTQTGAPPARRFATSVFVDGEVIIWGGDGSGPYFSSPINSGARYDPVADLWRPTSLVGAPAKRWGHTAVAAGDLMIVWGGGYNSGGRYDPLTDTWTPTSIGSAPAARFGHTSVWTGREMIVWGGSGEGGPLNSGGRYDPISATWTPTSMLGSPSIRSSHTAVWTGGEMVIWGGEDLDQTGYPRRLDTGGRYDPLTDSWRPTSMAGAPSPREWHTAVWTGERMIVWGGLGSNRLDGGGRYDPATDSWTPLSTFGAPSSRYHHVAVWTGDRMVVYGGYVYTGGYDTSGGRYDPVADSWSPTSAVGAPPGQDDSTAVWTGTQVIVWGGWQYEDIYTGAGGKYDPVLDTWKPTSMSGAPSLRTWHTAVWTGSRMVVWGGFAGGTVSSGGSQYDPVGNRWETVTATGAPLQRFLHTAVWTGEEMIVWGGENPWMLSSGGAYIPGAPPDQDGDGFRTCAGDCDDHDPAVYPGAAELCNAADDNCDGSMDEGFDVGASCEEPVDACHILIGSNVCAADGAATRCEGEPVLHDTTAPSLTVRADRTRLWPPKHQMVEVHLAWDVTDVCDGAPVVTLVSVTSGEPDDDPGPAHRGAAGDIAGADLGTPDRSVFLRAERNATGPGRVYRITYRATDASGNTTDSAAEVMVPHDSGLAPIVPHLTPATPRPAR